MTQVPFNFRFNVKSDYNYSEFSNFVECSDNIEPIELKDRYVSFLDDLLSQKIKPSTMVDVDVMWLFQSDLDNRAAIDYREGHWDHEPSIVRGGKFFDRKSREMADYLNSL